ncbi:hypothetical protein F511_40866 [Dorcoceras hygrometricum]|uniref:Uncharacterized protein n=1 Tax=Dorcoceras hygrometricum TaxID=472368 RepID=A0A2Z7C5V2_9LAMI|nr:hypothetical protein F511_40866 [Dorcoceras hygrometricum]
MLSTEAPPDLLCPRVISQQNSGSSNTFSIDEGDCDNNPQQQLKVDLFKSDLVDNNSPLPKFSIRDYVSSARGKDIKISWPFSEKNLQLCLKNGVTDVLPPFQSLAIVRNPSRMRSAYVKLPAPSNKILSSGFQEGNEFESTTRPSHTDINSVPLIKASCSKPEAVGSYAEKPESSAPASRKVEKSTQNSSKNCKLIVKLSRIAELPSIEHSEAMASKVCPVCKTFSSSSNTTLNAHIDQCLSEVSTMDWTSNSKVSKHRIKPRKTRLMMDIYSTALHCTLEDLDRRNGTNWATNMVFSTQDLGVCTNEKKKKRDSSSDVEGNEEGAAVYVDSTGAKFLCLSKCNDVPLNANAKDDCGTRKHVVINKESKFPSRKKRKVLVKRHKSIKHSHYGLASSSHGPSYCPEVNNAPQMKLFHEDGCEEEYTTQHVKDYDQMKSDEMGMVKQWVVGSKRNCFRKISHEHELQHLGKTVKNLIVQDSHSPRGGSFTKGKSDSNSPVLSDENSYLPSECRKREEKLQYTSHDERIEEPYLRKRAGFSMMMSRDSHGKRDRLALREFIMKQSRIDSTLINNCLTDPLSGTENFDFSGSNKRNEINTRTGLNAECSFSNSGMPHRRAFSYGGKNVAYPRQPPLEHVISPGHNKKSSLRKKFSATSAPVCKPEDNSGKRHLNFKKPRLRYPSSDDEAVVPRSAICRLDNQVEKLGVKAAQVENTSVQSSMEPARVLNVRKEGMSLNSGKEVGMDSTASAISPELENHGVRKAIDSFMGGSVPVSTSNVLDAAKEAGLEDEFVCHVIPERAGGEAFLAFSKSLDSSFYELAGPSNIKCVSQGYVETYNKHCPAELLLAGEPEMFYADKLAKSMTSSENGGVGEMDDNEGQRNYFVDVDPISIPGPPGSFLPSPGRMSSEELQGNSSLTTCRIQSSDDKHELMDVDSSDSPISSALMISESAAGRSDSASAKNLSELSDGIQDQSLCNISEGRVDESSKLSEPASHGEQAPDLEESRADLMLTANPHMFKNSQPCCCSRKEGAFLKDSFDCQGLQILRRRSIASLALWSQEKHIGGNLSRTAHSSNMGYAPLLVSQNMETKIPYCGDCKSPSPSTTNPVLRLMGKNLMVVNKDETLSPQMTQTHLSAAKESHPSMLSFVDNGVTTVRFPNEYYSIHQTLSKVPSRYESYDCMQHNMLAQHFDASYSNCFENTAKIRIQGSTTHLSAFMLSSKSFGESLASSSEHLEFANGDNMTSEFGSGTGPDTPITYDVEKVQTHGHQLIRSTDFSGSRNKETLVINESLKSEPGLAFKATHGGAKIEVRRSPAEISAPVIFGHDSRHMNPAFYNNQTRGFPVCSGSQDFYASNIQAPSSRGILKANSVKWNCTREGSAILHPNSLTASSPATGHPRSSMYFSPGFS